MIRRISLSSIALLLVAAAMPATVFADASLVSSEPPAGGTVAGTSDRIVATFDQTLSGKSTISLHDAAGHRILVGAVDDADRMSLTMQPATLEPGTYEVRWVADSADGHLVRGTYRFTISAPARSASPSVVATPSSVATGVASSSAAATVAPPSVSPTSSPTPSASSTSEPTASSVDVLLSIVGALALLAALGLFLLGRRRPADRP